MYAHPRTQVARLSRGGALLRLTDGYYVVVPDDRGVDWRPTLEAAALGVASAIYGAGGAVLMGVSAARVRGAIPRALATATVAVPRQHRAISLDGLGDVVVRFVQRDTDDLDAQLESFGALGRGLVTTVEQTILDLGRRVPSGADESQVREAIDNLWLQADQELLDELAQRQRGRATLVRLRGERRDRG
ncbi:MULTISPECIES: type IV toxin-antitoxin system AbiEi family antitoxin domain-containing protein [Mumia]|uniref:Type IV toxin-antitoxin system AbiEi family antitoxin n=1 Tax=Mumia xiangluensis TaxID=1678900 RepID=A0ABW1QQB9_9ACTN|nr:MULTISPECIES: type IV toxin-antitoxin system AbiEi family antitoxin [Mumia]